MLRVVAAMCLAMGCGRANFDLRPHFDGGADADSLATIDEPDAAPLDPNLVAWLQFEDDPADSVDDAVGVNANCVTTCPVLVPGPRGTAYQFDGIANALVTPDEARFQITTGTVAFWMRLEALAPASEYAFLVGKPFSTASQNSWELYFFGQTPTSSRIESGGDASSGVYAQVNWTIALGSWVHVATTWDSTVRIYIDGVEVAASAGFSTVFDSHPLAIGGDLSDTTWSRFVGASLDDLRIYNRVLAPAELLALAQP